MENKQRHILLNFGDVTCVDSAGVGELVACYKRTTAANGALKLLNLPEPVSDFLWPTRLREVFEIYDNKEQAIAAFSCSDYSSIITLNGLDAWSRRRADRGTVGQ